ncbi:MAG TPA: alpha/beta hydrolase [Vicinamibacterales bacterium]|nr:alpha/beta hydrolase [Vicinamibacterales bacterium]
MKRVLSRGVEIAYEVAGQGDPAVVLIHPPFGTRSHFDAIFEHLRQRNRVVALDLRGCGESGVPADGFRIADLAEDVRAVCRDAGVERAVLCGHSLGGTVALEVATIEPRLVAGVVLLDAVVLFPEPLRRMVLERLVPALAGPGWLEALHGYIDQRMFGPFDPPEVRTRIAREVAALPPQMPAALMREGMSQDFSDRLAAGKYPLLFVHAQVPADLQRLNQLRPDAIVASVAGSGHFLTLIVPDQVNAMLDRFLDIIRR